MHGVRRAKLVTNLGLLACFALGGCGEDGSTDGSKGGRPEGLGLPDGIFLADAPADITPIPELKKSAKEGDRVCVQVVIGGRVRPFVDNRAVMTVVDVGMHNACTLERDHCDTPWDFCCSSPEALKENLAAVQINDADGQPLEVNLPDTSKLAPLTGLVVQGTVGPRHDDQTLMINATGIYVEDAP